MKEYKGFCACRVHLVDHHFDKILKLDKSFVNSMSNFQYKVTY